MYKNRVNLAAVATRLGVKIEKRKYRMWNRVPHIGRTALVIDETVVGGGQRLMENPEHFPRRINEDYVTQAVGGRACSLGRMDARGKFIPWDRLAGDYPPGYFTHKIGE